MASKKERITISSHQGATLLDLGEMDIWDGADLALLRETLTRLIEQEGNDRIGVNMEHVKYIPSGFFGMLYDWHERGVEIRLYSPLDHVRQMLWFRQFFAVAADEYYLLHSEPKLKLIPGNAAEWHHDARFNGNQSGDANRVAAANRH